MRIFAKNRRNKQQPASTERTLIRLRQLVKEYKGGAGRVIALKDLNLDVQEGEFLVVTGKSGSGKTTFVNMVTGLDRVTRGEVWVGNVPVHKLGAEKVARWRGQTVGVVFQSFELLPTLTIFQNVLLPMDFAHRYSRRQRHTRAMHLLERVGIAEHAHKLPSAISGGQQQRVAIARALANDPQLLVADEPTGSLDSATARAVLDVFEDLVLQGCTVVLVTHDEDIAARAQRAIVLSDGKIIAS